MSGVCDDVSMKVTIWTTSPTHHQQHFFHAVRQAGVDLKVCYLRRIPERRLAMGWSNVDELPEGEMFAMQRDYTLRLTRDWKDRIHIVTGYGTHFLRWLTRQLSTHGVTWAHWSEAAYPGLRWWRSYIVKRWYARQVNRFALCCFGTGQLAFEDFRRWGVREELMAFLPYSVPPLKTSSEQDDMISSFCRDHVVFLFAGSLYQGKGIDILIRSFRIVRAHNSRCRLVLVGNDRTNGRYERLAQHLGIAHDVLFRGVVPVQRMSAVMRAARVLILPSRYDGWGVSLNEGASVGLALIATDRVGAAYHLIQAGENGFRVRAGCTDSLAKAMGVYASDERLACEHGQHSLKLFQEFTPERNAVRFINCIRSWQHFPHELRRAGHKYSLV
jgi:glycosyltransferase involved in cell wall biosynthesis